MTAIEITLFLKLLALAGALGLGSKLTTWLLGKLPSVDVHTKSALLNKVLDTLGNAAEAVVRAALSGQDVDALLTAMSAGTPVGVALAALLPGLEANVKKSIGPVTEAALGQLTGDEGAAHNITQAVASAVHDLALAHKAAGSDPQPGQVVQLTSGHLLVVPHDQQLPAGAKLIVSLGGLGSVAKTS